MSHRSPKDRRHNPTTKRLDRGRGRNQLIPTQPNNIPLINKRPQYTLNHPPKSINREIPPTRARNSYEYRKNQSYQQQPANANQKGRSSSIGSKVLTMRLIFLRTAFKLQLLTGNTTQQTEFPTQQEQDQFRTKTPKRSDRNPNKPSVQVTEHTVHRSRNNHHSTTNREHHHPSSSPSSPSHYKHPATPST